jgi:molecular chaperone HtpG
MPKFGRILAWFLKKASTMKRRDALLALSRFKTTASGGSWRSLKEYISALKQNQTAIYYLTGDDIARLEASPHVEGFRARGVEVLLLIQSTVSG